MKKILILGGGGYKGTVLVKYLLEQKYEIRVIDNFWFGNYLPSSKNLEIKQKDIRDIDKTDFIDVDKIIHLANIANDPSVELDQNLSWEINVLATKKIIELSIDNNLEQMIFASSGSVYGVKSEEKVTEDLGLVPVSTYNKTKMIAERVLMSYSDKIKIHCIRPATVCGYSERMRLDVSVNILTYQALKNRKVTIFGGSQIRPNINIHDMKRVYKFFIKNNENISSGFYNAGFENKSILDIANLVRENIDCEFEIQESIDIRSYRLSSDKLLSLGFEQKYYVKDAVEEIKDYFNNGFLNNIDNMSNISWLKKQKYK